MDGTSAVKGPLLGYIGYPPGLRVMGVELAVPMTNLARHFMVFCEQKLVGEARLEQSVGCLRVCLAISLWRWIRWRSLTRESAGFADSMQTDLKFVSTSVR